MSNSASGSPSAVALSQLSRAASSPAAAANDDAAVSLSAAVKHCCFKYNCYTGGDDDGDQHNGSRVTCDTVHCKDHVVFSCV